MYPSSHNFLDNESSARIKKVNPPSKRPCCIITDLPFLLFGSFEVNRHIVFIYLSSVSIVTYSRSKFNLDI